MSSPKQAIEAIHVPDELSDGSVSPATAQGAAGLGDKPVGVDEATMGPEGGNEQSLPLEDTQEKLKEGHEPSAIRDTKEKELIGDVSPVENGLRSADSTPDYDAMESSTATLRPVPHPPPKPTSPTSAHHLSPDEHNYRDPTPKTPKPSNPPSRSTSKAHTKSHSAATHDERERSPTRSDVGFDDKNSASEDERESDSRSEIQSIMDQFSEEGHGPGHEEVMSPRLEIAGPLLGSSIQHPPRKSSLEPLNSNAANAVQSDQDLRLASTLSNRQVQNENEQGPAVPPKPGSIHSFRTVTRQPMDAPMSPPPVHRPPPPEPEPEPALPFDFHRFLEQLRHRTADPVAKFLRSFLQEFGKKQWMVHEQVKIISDFLAFITNKMAQCEVWREVSDAEFDNAREGMEKLVMNRLYTQTFSPAIPPPQPLPVGKSKRKGAERAMGPGRRGQHQEDVERDDILAQKVRIYGWIKEEHLEIPPVGESGKRFLVLAEQELLKIKTYRAPRDKIICVLNCCKVIFGLLKHSKSDSSADSFMPLLIYVVLQANPEHLVSNVQYILRFRNQEKLGGEAGYYLSSLLGAVQFIENLDRTSLTISDEEFEKNVEAAVSTIAEKHQVEVAGGSPPTQLSEKSTISRTEVTPRPSIDGEASVTRESMASNEDDNGDVIDEKAAMTGLFRTIQRPLSSIGRIFSEEAPTSSNQGGPARTPLTGNNPSMSSSPRTSTERPRSPLPPANKREAPRNRMTAEDSAARQASAEAAEAHRIQRAEHSNVVETLAGMFPDLDREIISDVVAQKEGRVGLAVDACLALSS